MADLWYPGGIHDPAPPSVWENHTATGRPKFLLHTTESPLGVYTPDPRTGPGRRYYGNTGTWPNYTLAREGRSGRWRIYNHIPANRASLSLRNRPGGVETDRGNVTQVEIATRAVDIGSLPGDALEELAKLLAWEHAARGVPLASGVRWVPHPASYGERASQRLSGAAWNAYAGVLGHQHAPENDHGDPGSFPIDTLLRRAREIAGGDDVTEQDKKDIANAVLAALRAQVFDVTPPIRQGNAGQVIGATYNKVGEMQPRLNDTQSRLSDAQSRLDDVATRIDFIYDQLGKFAAASGIVLDPPPWREDTSA